MEYDQELCDYLVKRFGIRHHDLLLDVGCGNGKHVDCFQRFGVDARGIDKEDCDLEKDPIPFPDNSFDVVFCKSVLEHIDQYERVLCHESLGEDIRRVLKPDGIAIVMVPVETKFFFTYPDHKVSFNQTQLQFTFGHFGEGSTELFYQFPWIWKHPWLKIIPKLIAWLVPDNYRFRKDGTQRVLIRHSKEPMWLLWARK